MHIVDKNYIALFDHGIKMLVTYQPYILDPRFVPRLLIPKKVELLIQFFEPFWISRVFHFSLGTFSEVPDLPDPLEASDETYTQGKFDITGSNETMQNALAAMV